MKILKVFFVISLICSITSLDAQIPYFYAMEDSMVLYEKFYKTDTIIVISPDSEPISAVEKQEVEDFVFYGKRPVFIFKKESDIVPMDLKKHLHIFGAIFKFKNVYSQIPVKPCANGFLYNTESFTKDNDAFIYLNENAKILYSCKNKVSAISPFFSGIYAYQFLIFRDYEICYSGFLDETSHKENINDIRKFKKQYFQQKSTEFFNLNIAKTLNVDSIIDFLPVVLDKYVLNLCDYLKVDTNNITKMNLYIYADRIDLQKFIAAPLWGTIWGKCVGNVLHSSNVNIATIEHETAHSIIMQKIGFYSSPLFDEGFRQYTEYFFNKEAYNSDLKITKTNLEFLNEELLDVHKFYNHQQNYCISGIFVKYLIDKIGYSEFKTAFSQGKIVEYLNEKYKMSTEQLFAEFKNSL